MLERRSIPGPVERARVAVCLRELRSAREHVESARHNVSLRWQRDLLRAQLLTALESYEKAIIQLGAPVPQRLRLEIDLYRGLQRRA